MRCQLVCLLRLACWRQEGGGNCRNRESRVEEGEGGGSRRSVCIDGWMDGWIPCSPFAL